MLLPQNSTSVPGDTALLETSVIVRMLVDGGLPSLRGLGLGELVFRLGILQHKSTLCWARLCFAQGIRRDFQRG